MMHFFKSFFSFCKSKPGAVMLGFVLASLVLIPNVAYANLASSVVNLLTSGVYFLLAMLIKLLVILLDIVMLFIGFFMEKANETQETVRQAWVAVRNFVNLGFIFVLIFAAVINIFSIDFDGFSLRDILPRVIYAAIMVNFSYLFVYLLLDFSSVLEAAIYTQLTAQESGVSAIGPHGSGLGSAFQQALQYQNLGLSTVGASFDRLIRAAMSFVILLVFLGAFVPLMFIYAARMFYIWVLAILSPLYFFAGAAPSLLGKQRDDWWANMKKWGFVNVKLAFYLSLAYVVARSVASANKDTFSQALVSTNEATPALVQGTLSLDKLLMYALVLGMVFLAVKEATAEAGDLPGPMQDAMKSTDKFVKDRAKGAGSYGAAKLANATVGSVQSLGKLGGQMAKSTSKATGLNKAAKAIKDKIATQSSGKVGTGVKNVAGAGFTAAAFLKGGIGGFLKGKGLDAVKDTKSIKETIKNEKRSMKNAVKNTIKDKGVNIIRSVAADAKIEEMKREDMYKAVKKPFTGEGDLALEEMNVKRAKDEKKADDKRDKMIFDEKNNLLQDDIDDLQKEVDANPNDEDFAKSLRKKQAEQRKLQNERMAKINKNVSDETKGLEKVDLEAKFKDMELEMRDGELHVDGKKADFDTVGRIHALEKALASKDMNDDNLDYHLDKIGMKYADKDGKPIAASSYNDPAKTPEENQQQYLSDRSAAYSKMKSNLPIESDKHDPTKGVAGERSKKADKDAGQLANTPGIHADFESKLIKAIADGNKTGVETISFLMKKKAFKDDPAFNKVEIVNKIDAVLNASDTKDLARVSKQIDKLKGMRDSYVPPAPAPAAPAAPPASGSSVSSISRTARGSGSGSTRRGP